MGRSLVAAALPVASHPQKRAVAVRAARAIGVVQAEPPSSGEYRTPPDEALGKDPRRGDGERSGAEGDAEEQGAGGVRLAALSRRRSWGRKRPGQEEAGAEDGRQG